MSSPAEAAAPRPPLDANLSPECWTAAVLPQEVGLHADCGYPGYRHPRLGWMPRECQCKCHTEEAAK